MEQETAAEEEPVAMDTGPEQPKEQPKSPHEDIELVIGTQVYITDRRVESGVYTRVSAIVRLPEL